jgi:hypothetical protein
MVFQEPVTFGTQGMPMLAGSRSRSWRILRLSSLSVGRDSCGLHLRIACFDAPKAAGLLPTSCCRSIGKTSNPFPDIDFEMGLQTPGVGRAVFLGGRGPFMENQRFSDGFTE